MERNYLEMASNCFAHCNFRLINVFLYKSNLCVNGTALQKKSFFLVMSRAVRLLLLLLLSSFARFLLIFWSKSRTRMRIQYAGFLGIACVLTEWAIMNKLQRLKRLSHQLGIISSMVFVASSQHLVNSANTFNYNEYSKVFKPNLKWDTYTPNKKLD